jgi:hypothetical protein
LESRVIVTCQIRAWICPGRRGIILIIGGRRLIKLEVRLVKKKKTNRPGTRRRRPPIIRVREDFA